MTQEWAAKANELAREIRDGANLTGSEKQIAWAKDIIQEFVFVASTSQFKTTEQDKAREFIAWVVKNHTAAKWWIDHRNMNYRFFDSLIEDWEDEND